MTGTIGPSKTRKDLFATPVFLFRHPELDGLIAPLKSVIEAKQSQSAGIGKSNLGGWHSDTDMVQWGGEPAQALAQFAAIVARDELVDVGPKTVRDFRWNAEMWANVNKPGDSNQMHCHPGATWSAVFYVEPGDPSPNGGSELVLEDPRFPMAHMALPDLLLTSPDGSPQKSLYMVPPERGLLVLFPSWLRHSVRPHTGTSPRISIAINYTLRPEAIGGHDERRSQ